MGMALVQRAIELGPELELRVRRPDGSVEGRRVREGMTIGRSAASDLAIDDPGVHLIHARVTAGIGGSHELRCVGGGRLITQADECVECVESVDRLILKVGVEFVVGETKVECGRWERKKGTDVKSQKLNVKGGEGNDVKCQKSNVKCEDGVAVVEMPRLVVCPACYRDMTGVSVVARFCPVCGSRLPARDAAGYLIPPEESSPLFVVYQSLRKELEEKLADESPQVATSLIILAYANALLNLGWKYEHGRGALKNVEEAARCYAKAGRLAEAWGKMPD
jgi:hypothetical protein